ncbi:TldD/PmbA family protein [Candidatus Aminicenantes bacterium AC-334-K16]|jgi:PmbA protein|nr:TldD/PmbA family protein [Candidatus Aminicenantes bacterium AC-334-K16]
MDYKILTEDLVKLCLKKGADAAEVYLEVNRHLSVEIRNQEIETVEEASSHGVGFRVFTKGRMAFASCNDFSEKSLEEAITRAINMSHHTTSDENNILPDNQDISPAKELYDPSLKNIELEKKIALAMEAEKIALASPQITKSAGASYGEIEREIFLANSNGLSKNFKESACSFGVSVVAEKGEEKSSGGEYCARRFFTDLKKPEEVATKAAQDAYEMLNARLVKTQQAAVIFDPDVARAILGGILGAVNGERVLQGASFLKDKLNQKIASELITIIDDGLLPKGLSSRPFDGEGVPTQKRAIVEQGILKGFMYNTIVARRAGVQSTGNASRAGFTSLPGIGPHNFYLMAGPHHREEIIKATKRGLLLKGVTGYGINPVNGHFSGGASGFWIENGRIAFPVKGLTIAGQAFQMLMSIDMVADDLDLNRSFTAPTFRIPVMQIGGK